MKKLIRWDIYEISTHGTSIHGVMFRGRIRKLSIEHKKNVILENSSDIDNVVRFAITEGEDITFIEKYVNTITPDAHIKKALSSIVNPVLSKLKVNNEERYTL